MPARQASSWLYRRAGYKVKPHQSGVHRVACLTLYKHFLRQIPRSPLDQKLLHDVIRAEFRADARLRIHADIRQSLTTGYRALSLLEGLHKESLTTRSPQTSSKEAPRSAASTLSQQIATLNANLLNLSISQPADPEPPARPPPPRLEPFPGGNKILARPLPASALTGRRHIPKLVNAGGLPFLRVKKPQPPLISKILRDKIATRQRRQNYLDALDETLVWALDEDEWDFAMGELRRRDEVYGASLEMDRGEVVGEKSFAATMREAIAHVRGLLVAEQAKQVALAKKFWQIVVRETALVEKEAGERRQAELGGRVGNGMKKGVGGVEQKNRSASAGKE